MVSAWWFALPVLVALGAIVARRAGRLDSSLLAVWCGVGVALQYLFLINYAAPRFLLPAYALLAIPVADALSCLITGVRRDWRPVAIGVVAVGVAAQLVVQHAVLEHQVREKSGFFGDYTRIAADLHDLGIRAPCLIKGEQDIPVAFYAGCASAPAVATVRTLDPAEPVAVLVPAGQQPPGYARQWTRHDLPGIRTRLLELRLYVAPG